MKRRRLLQSLAAIPAVPAAAQYSPSTASGTSPTLAAASPEAVADTAPVFFSPSEAAAMRKLAAAIVPASGARPGALEAGAVEFLDFLLSQSSPERRKLYREGLAKAGTGSPDLAPLAQAWTYEPPKDPYTRFLRELKQDLLEATVNSRQFAQAMASRSRSAAGMGAYWLPFD